jgi:alpha-galactosidase
MPLPGRCHSATAGGSGRLHGRRAAESPLLRSELTYGENVLSSRRGHTGHQHLPWVALDADGATEEQGEVYGCALAWSGSWRISVQQLPDKLVQITGGAGYDDSGLLRLAPGESYTSPVFAGLWSEGGFGGAGRAWHAWRPAHVIPDAATGRPVLYNSWEATGFELRRIPAAAAAQRISLTHRRRFVRLRGGNGDRWRELGGE